MICFLKLKKICIRTIICNVFCNLRTENRCSNQIFYPGCSVKKIISCAIKNLKLVFTVYQGINLANRGGHALYFFPHYRCFFYKRSFALSHYCMFVPFSYYRCFFIKDPLRYRTTVCSCILLTIADCISPPALLLF